MSSLILCPLHFRD